MVSLQQLLRSRSNSPAQEEGAVFFMWGTDHEDAGIVNAQELRKRDPAMFFDWKSHTKVGALSVEALAVGALAVRITLNDAVAS